MEEPQTLSLHFEERGSGRPLLLIHGFPFSSRMWAGQQDALSGAARVLAPDLPGFGESPAVDSATVESYAEDCVALLDALDILEPVAVGGLSMGGYIALAFARLFPERTGALLLLSTRAGADSAEGKAGRDATIAKVKEHGPGVVAEGMFPKLLAPATYSEQPAVAAELQTIMATASQQGVVAALGAMRDRPDASGLLAELQAPALVLHGTEDQVIPHSEAEAMAAALPHARLELLEGAGHVPNLEQPERFNQVVLDFLANS
ncbi:MAG: alpha/beta fold hydrolase [Anaerolineales bacterium]|nr:alpha/beta fold hydrolase [Anaerolineales bacterium]